MRATLQPRHLLALMDFTSQNLTDKPSVGEVVQDCIVVLEYMDPEGHLMRTNYDFLCSDSNSNKHDFFFVLAVWTYLFASCHLDEAFESIDVWTDGGPHHFKTRWCQWMWHSLSNLRFHGKRISHHFFPSYHGHCDRRV